MACSRWKKLWLHTQLQPKKLSKLLTLTQTALSRLKSWQQQLLQTLSQHSNRAHRVIRGRRIRGGLLHCGSQLVQNHPPICAVPPQARSNCYNTHPKRPPSRPRAPPKSHPCRPSSPDRTKSARAIPPRHRQNSALCPHIPAAHDGKFLPNLAFAPKRQLPAANAPPRRRKAGKSGAVNKNSLGRFFVEYQITNRQVHRRRQQPFT